MGGSDTKQQHVHQYVLESISSVPAARNFSWQLVRTIFGVALLASLITIFISIVLKKSTDEALILSLGYLLASVPFSIFVQRFGVRTSLKRENLRLNGFVIGLHQFQKNPDTNLIDNELGEEVSSDFQSNILPFAIACDLVCYESTLRPSRPVAAWQWHGSLAGLPGVAVGLTTFGPSNQPYAFLYGQSSTILNQATDNWDLGHVRKIAENDINNAELTIKNWKRHGGTPLALAYAPLPITINISEIHSKDILRHLTLLGLINVDGTRDKKNKFNMAPATSSLIGGYTSFTNSLLLIFYGFLSYLMSILFSAPITQSLLQVIAIKFVIESLTLTVMAWDGVGIRKLTSGKKHLVYEGLWSSVLIGGLALTNFSLYFERHGASISATTAQSTIHTGAMAIGFATLSIGGLANLILLRGKSFGWRQFQNPLFNLAIVSSLLIVLLTVLIIGPLLGVDWFYVLLAIGIFVTVRELQAYANKHHTRDHIIEMLRTT